MAGPPTGSCGSIVDWSIARSTRCCNPASFPSSSLPKRAWRDPGGTSCGPMPCGTVNLSSAGWPPPDPVLRTGSVGSGRLDGRQGGRGRVRISAEDRISDLIARRQAAICGIDEGDRLSIGRVSIERTSRRQDTTPIQSRPTSCSPVTFWRSTRDGGSRGRAYRPGAYRTRSWHAAERAGYPGAGIGQNSSR